MVFWLLPSSSYWGFGLIHNVIIQESLVVFHALTFAGPRGSLFEHDAARPSVQISSEGPGKCYCNEITMDDRCSCITYDSNGKLWRKRPKAPYKFFKCDGKPIWRLVQNVLYNEASCAMTL